MCRRRELALEDVRRLLMKAHRDNSGACKEHPISVSVADVSALGGDTPRVSPLFVAALA